MDWFKIATLDIPRYSKQFKEIKGNPELKINAPKYFAINPINHYPLDMLKSYKIVNTASFQSLSIENNYYFIITDKFICGLSHQNLPLQVIELNTLMMENAWKLRVRVVRFKSNFELIYDITIPGIQYFSFISEDLWKDHTWQVKNETDHLLIDTHRINSMKSEKETFPFLKYRSYNIYATMTINFKLYKVLETHSGAIIGGTNKYQRMVNAPTPVFSEQYDEEFKLGEQKNKIYLTSDITPTYFIDDEMIHARGDPPIQIGGIFETFYSLSNEYES